MTAIVWMRYSNGGDTMIKKMKWKFVAFVMFCVTVLMVIVVGGINLFSLIQIDQHYDQLLEILVENDGEFSDGFFDITYDISESNDNDKKDYNSNDNSSKDDNSKDKGIIDTVDNNDTDERELFDRLFRYNLKITRETPFENRYFLVYLDKNGNVTGENINHISAISEETAIEYAMEAFELGAVKGTMYDFRYLIKKCEDGYTVAFVNMYQQIQNMYYIQKLSVLLSGTILLILFVIIYLASGKALEPIVQNMEKQKQFITDAGHELKTPLAVISADVDVIELTAGKSEWTDSIRKQTVQMSELIKHLLFLSKMEEKYDLVMEEINLSQISKEVTERISKIAVSQNKNFDTDIQDDIIIKGDRSGMEHLVSVLTENAVKYCSDNGNISVKLFKSGKTVHLEVRNTGEPLDEKMIPRLFDRFFRPDEARTRENGGHGIGLSIAKAIVTAHKGKIGAHNEPDNIVAFTVEL